MRDFLYDLRHYKPRVALNNALIRFTMRFIGAVGYHIDYPDDKCPAGTHIEWAKGGY